MTFTRLIFLSLLVISGSCLPVSGQEKPVPVCSEKTFATIRPLPKPRYACSESLIESDSRILRLPRRRAALARVMETLRSYTNPAWWEASVNELNACELRGRAGELGEDDKARWQSGDHFLSLFGDQQTRLVLIDDPCYQTGFNGSNAYLLQRKDGGVIVTQVLDGYYSRVDNSVGVNFATLNGKRVFEVTTGNSMPPSLVSYFFIIDRAGRAIPKRIFRVAGRLTNEIHSVMLLGDPQDFSLPAEATELNIIRNGRLAPRFSAYEANEHGPIETNSGKVRRVIYRWNGRSYSRAN